MESLPSRKSSRLPEFDYSQPGAYAITMVTHKRICRLGQIEGDEVRFTPLGKIVKLQLERLPVRFAGLSLDEYVVMPNHLHMVLVIEHERLSSYEAFGKPAAGSIPTIVRSFKSSVTQHYRHFEHTLLPLWQRNYYEHIIRDEKDWQRIRDYIQPGTLGGGYRILCVGAQGLHNATTSLNVPCARPSDGHGGEETLASLCFSPCPYADSLQIRANIIVGAQGLRKAATPSNIPCARFSDGHGDE